MPNHCHNRVEFYSEDTTAILKLHAIFNKALADELKEPVDTVFGSFIPEPDWSKVPLAESDVKSIHSLTLEVRSVSCQYIKTKDLAGVYISLALM